MTTTTTPLAFRCNKCWQLTCSDAEMAGKSVPCLSCSTSVVVPEATPERIKAGEEYVADASSGAIQSAKIDLNESLTDTQIRKIAADKVKAEMKASSPIGGYAACRMKRFIGSLIDGFAMLGAILAGLLLVAVLVGDPKDAAVQVVILFLVLPIMLGICQAYMIAVEGRTIGKYCMGTKIVNQLGNPPGFLQGVVIRIWVVALLGTIPFFNLVDAIWIFGDEKRCLHDVIAGTTVIDVI